MIQQLSTPVPVLTPVFDQSDSETIADEIKHNTGYCIFEKAIAPEALMAIVDKIKVDGYLVNNNSVGVVRSASGNFLSHTLAVSKHCYDIVTSEKVRAICQNYFDRPYKVVNQRLYETHTKAHLPWHTDNNLQSGNSFGGKHPLPGIVFLFYLTDVSDTNPFQLIPGSHRWADESTERYFSDEYIERNYADKIVSVRAPKGTLIACNSHLVHRAEPFNRPGFSRYTFIFQVDEISDDYVGHGEPLLINPSFVNDTSPEILDYLGFGTQSDYLTLPHTSAATLSPQDLLRMQKSILPKALRGLVASTAKSLLPGSLLNIIRNRLY